MLDIFKQSSAVESSNTLLSPTCTMWAMKKTAWQIVAANVERLRVAKGWTQDQLAKKAELSQTGVGNLLRPGTPAMESPKLITVEKVAGAFGLQTWQLLVDPDTFGQEIAAHITRPAVTNDRIEEKGFKKPEEPPPASRATNRGRRRTTA
jgi:transcriptional regulator with XRE-family HTH domain